MVICICVVFLLAGADAFAKGLAAEVDITVATDGSGDFTTIQAAIDAAPSNSDRTIIIYIKRGLYNSEKLIVPSDKKNLTFIGESREETIISYHIYDCADGYNGKCPAADASLLPAELLVTSATLTIQGDGFRAENLTIQNTAGPVGQAQAITVQADKVVFINCDIKSYQDTMYLWTVGKRCYFEGCLIVGRTDYIYGACIAFFQSCEIRSWGGGWITAPSTPIDQTYGFVFNECSVTYATGSPRTGDDGSLIRFGRPWHEYPKVAWLYCDMTEMIHPEGWGDEWNMTYAATSTDLHLYEYANTGEGADMSGRATWAGLRALTADEALDYSVQMVLGGTDNWDPSADAPLVQTYNWTGEGASKSWLLAENWDPAEVPASGQSAFVISADTVEADGGTFAADLSLKDNAALIISGNSSVTYVSAGVARFMSSADVTLSGKIATKDSIRFYNTGTLTLNASISGIHELVKHSSGKLVLNADNINFSGDIIVLEGSIEASVAGSLGKSSVEISNGTTLVIGNDNAFSANSFLKVVSGSSLVLNANVTTSEFYIDGAIQETGIYTAATNPSVISGTGSIIVGRPEVFTFTGAVNGLWDVAGNYSPALMPLEGESALCSIQMETTATVYAADIIMSGAGMLRLRGNHESTGTIHMGQGTSFYFNTSGTGFSIKAPVLVEGNMKLTMESSSATGCNMTLGGPVSGTYKITALNNGKGTVNTGTVILTGDNSSFSGTWALTEYSNKYPAVAGYITCIDGQSENAFGAGIIEVGYANKVIFSNSKAVGDNLILKLGTDSRAVLNASISVKTLTLNGKSIASGVYSASTNPELYEGTGTLTVTEGGEDPVEPISGLPAFPGAEGYGKYTTGGRGGQVYYVTTTEDVTTAGSLRYALNQSGARIVLFKVSGTIKLNSPLRITNGNVTIAGQTAPGDGICIRDYPVTIEADNVIIRFIRFRLGDESNTEADALGGRFHKNIIIDHCSMSWSVDECVSFYQNENFTLQWCLISESLRNSVHDKGAHGYGGIWGGKMASFHHNLLAHHDSRNPRLGESSGDIFARTDLVDLRNNVIYNWQGNSCYGGEAMNVNIVNCYYKPGPATTKTERIIAIDKNLTTTDAVYNIWGKFFIDGNYLSASTRATSDNWTYGVYNQFHDKYGTVSEADKTAMKLLSVMPSFGVTTHTAQDAYTKVLAFVGASLVRDPVDTRIIYEVTNGNATYMDGGNGSVNGIIDSQTAVGGWPVLSSSPAPDDTDNDGMPDSWETANGLNTASPADAQLLTVDGQYPNIEVYINSLVSPIIQDQNLGGVLSGIKTPDYYNSAVKAWFNNQTNVLSIEHTSQMKIVFIYSLDGSLLCSTKCNQLSAEIYLQYIIPGVYIVKVLDDNNLTYTRKFVVL